MAKLYFRYGAMGSSKSANALMTAHNFEEQGRKVLLAKPSIDTRWKDGEITSRAGNLHNECKILFPQDNIKDYILNYEKEIGTRVEAIIIDEAQFLTREQVKGLAQYVDEYNVPILCYGLKNSAIDGKFFEGSEALLYWADSIEELKTLCSFCSKKAIMNLRVKNGIPVYEGNVVCLGDVGENEGTEYYYPTCRHHYYNPKLI